NSEPPVIGPSSRCHDPIAPSVPPRRDKTSEWLNDKNVTGRVFAASDVLDHAAEDVVSRRIRQLVQCKCRQERRRGTGECDLRYITAPNPSGESERVIGLNGLGHRPRVAIDGDNCWSAVTR